MGRGVWGIDVSKYSVKAARLEKVRDSIELTALDVVKYAGAGTGQAAALDDQIREALADLKSNNKIGGERIVISLPGHSTFNRLIKLPPVEDAKIAEIIRYEAQQQIPFNIEEVLWDYQIIQRQYAPGEEKEVILFAIKRDIVEQFLDNIREVGLNIDAVQFGPVGLYNFLLCEQQVGAAAVALDIGSDNTDLVIIDGAKFWVRNLPITGNDITRALQKAFNIPFAEAEKLKLKAGQTQQAQKIFNAIQPVLRDLVGEIHRSIGYYKSISKQIRFERIHLMGNATRTLNFQKFISQSLQMPAARVQKLSRISVGSVDAGLLNNALPSLGTALGLALQGLEETANRVNLLPPDYLKKKELKKKQPFVVGIAAALYALVAVMYLQASGEVEELRILSQQTSSVAAQVNGLAENWENAKKLVPKVEEKLKPLPEIPTERDLVLKVLDEINPNLTDNSERGKPDTDKIWVLEWNFAEQDGNPPTDEKAGSSRSREIPVLPKERALHATLELAISRRNSAREATDFVIRKLLNFNPTAKQGKGMKIDPNKKCVIDQFHLERGKLSGMQAGWDIAMEQDIPAPVPRRVLEGSEPPEWINEIGENKFSRVLLTLHIPMVGDENRKPKAEEEAKAEAPEAPATPDAAGKKEE